MITVGIKTKDNIYIGAASYRFTLPSAGYKKDNFAVYVPKSHPDLLVSFTGTILEANIFKYRHSPIDAIEGDFELTPKTVLQDIGIPFIKSLYEEHLLKESEKFDQSSSSILLAKNNKLFGINYSLYVKEADDFICLDEGDFVAEAVLCGIGKDNDPIYRMLKAISLAIECKTYAGEYPIIIKNTQNLSKTLIFSREKTKKYIEHYERNGGVK